MKRNHEVNSNIKDKLFKIDWKRSKAFFLWGAVVNAPFLHVAYSKVFPYLVPELTTIGAMKKLVLDLSIRAPTLAFIFYPCTALFNGRTMKDAREDLRGKYWDTLMLNYKIWPAASLINFAYVPIKYQVLWANFVSLVFIVCLSFLANTK